MEGVADSSELRSVLHRFVRAHVVNQPAVVSARISSDDDGPFVLVEVEPDRQVDLPDVFEDLRVVRGERQPGYVAAGPLMLR
jgi:hypothetical protein